MRLLRRKRQAEPPKVQRTLAGRCGAVHPIRGYICMRSPRHYGNHANAQAHWPPPRDEYFVDDGAYYEEHR